MRAALLALLLAAPAAAAPAPPPGEAPRTEALCEAAGRRAAAAEGVPEDLLRAVSLAETGRARGGALRPWPWTVNMEGEGRWFAGPAPLLAWVRARMAAGARSFDLGCFQVNHLWHGHAFPGLEAMLEPEANARYAARFLRSLYEESGDWETAAGWYHSRTPELAARYRSRVLRLAGAPPAEGPRAAPSPGGRMGEDRRGLAGPGGVTLALFALPRAGGRAAPPRGSLLAGGGRGPLLTRGAGGSLIAASRAAPAETSR